MFCQECGKKNVKGAKFCEDCGAKLVSNSKVSKEKKPLDKKTKVLVGTILTIVILFAICFGILSNKYKPTNVAKDYFLVLTSGDTDKLYDYLDVKNSGFTSKKVFEKVVKLSKEDITNYSVGEGKLSDDGLTMTVPINYTTRGVKTSDVFTVNLVKNKEKKFLFFDNWEVSNESSEVKTDFSLRVPKDSKVSLEGIALDKKYLDKEDSSLYDKYIIPQIFKGKYNAVVTLKNGFVLDSDVDILGSSAYLTNLELPSKEKEKLTKKLPKIIDTIYQNAVDKKAFGDIKRDYEYDGANLSDLERSYTSLTNGTELSGLTKFTTKDVKIISSKLSGSYISITAKINFEYTAKRSWFGEEKTNTKEDEDTVYLDFDYSNGEYKLVDISSFPKYFSVL